MTATIKLGHGDYARTVTPIQLEGTTLYQDAAGTIHKACGRCSGTGKVWAMHVYAGECFECHHAGVRRFADDLDSATAKLKKAARAAARREAKRQAEVDAAEAARCTPEAIAAAHELALKVNERENAKAAAVEASRHVGAPGDRVTVKGVVAVAMDVEAEDFRTGRPTTKRFVIVKGHGEDDGITLKLTGTAQALYDIEKGEDVTITASVKAHTTGRDGEAVTTAIRPKLV